MSLSSSIVLFTKYIYRNTNLYLSSIEILIYRYNILLVYKEAKLSISIIMSL